MLEENKKEEFINLFICIISVAVVEGLFYLVVLGGERHLVSAAIVGITSVIFGNIIYEYIKNE